MDKVIDLITTFLGNTNYINFFSIIVVAVTTYQVAKYNTSKPNKLKVKQAQLDNVYLPLYRISIRNQYAHSFEQVSAICKEIDAILDEHYVLVFPQLHTLNKDLKVALSIKGDYSEILKSIFHQVSVDYELLKKALGYPSENIFNIFIRMTNSQKLEFALSHLNMLWFGFFVGTAIFETQNPAPDKIGTLSLLIHISMILFNAYYIKTLSSKKKH